MRIIAGGKIETQWREVQIWQRNSRESEKLTQFGTLVLKCPHRDVVPLTLMISQQRLNETLKRVDILSCGNCKEEICMYLSILQILKPSEKKAKYQYTGMNSGRPSTPQRNPTKKK